MNIINYIRRSLAARLSLGVVSCVVIVFILVLGILFHYSRIAVRDEAMGRATQALESTQLHVENTLHDTEVAVSNMKWLVEQHLNTPDSMYTYSRKILENNPDFYGCSIAFEPFLFEEKGQFFSAYSYNGKDSIQTEQEGNEAYEYYYMDWYLIPKLLDKPYWVEPFKDYDNGGIKVNDYITSYSYPIHDKNDRVVGILSVDLSLKWFSQNISKGNLFPHSYSILIGRGGTYLVHPDTTKLFYETIFTHTLEKPNEELTALGKAMVAGESGYKVLHREEGELYVFYKPLPHTGWSVAIVCPESDIFEPYLQLQNNMIFIMIAGVLVLFLFCVITIRRNIRPLKLLGQSAERMSEGNYEKVIPDSKRRDEIGQLQHSFSTMQQSLLDYIHKIKRSTETLTQRNAELLKANELAKEDDRMKTAVINNMTNQMLNPIDAIVKENDLIRKEYKNISEEEMAQHVDCMLEKTETVTRLLNQLLEASDTTNLSNEEPAES